MNVAVSFSINPIIKKVDLLGKISQFQAKTVGKISIIYIKIQKSPSKSHFLSVYWGIYSISTVPFLRQRCLKNRSVALDSAALSSSDSASVPEFFRPGLSSWQMTGCGFS